MERARGVVLGGGSFLQAGQAHRCLVRIDLDAPTPAVERVLLPFLPHGVSPHPTRPGLLATFEKKGPGAALLGPSSLTPLPTTPARQFYGHGAWSADGATLFSVESIVDRSFRGVLVARDGASLQELGEIHTYGTSPHDCHLIEGGSVMVVANGGGPHGGDDPGSVAWIELSSGKLLERCPIDDPRFNAGHLALAGGALAVVSAPRDGLPAHLPQRGAVSLRPPGKPLRTLQGPARAVERMVGESLSVAIDPGRDLVLATHPLGDAVTVWKLSTSKLVEVLEPTGPRGVAVALDGRSYLIAHLQGGVPQLTEIDPDTLRPTGLRVNPSYLTGSHLLVQRPLDHAERSEHTS
ncbi:MAG: DUF1513 domain-containing protein [Polyangiaceae bacterium]|jgi:hypothetical protein|nr:DUF1513 domain-containing protein [Polyangiaceae bacterium]